MIDPRKELDGLLDRLLPEMRQAFLAVISDVTDNVILQDFIEAIKNNDYEKAFRLLGFDEAAMRPFIFSFERVFETAGILVGQTFPSRLLTNDGPMIFRFNVRNKRAEEWIRNHSSSLITNLREETRVNVRNVMTQGLAEGRNPRNVALDIVGRIDRATGKRTGGIIGLAANQELWVRSTQAKLETLDKNYFNLELRDKRFDRTVEKAIADNKPLPRDVIEKLVNRYKNNALRHRATTIARTETMSALSRADYEATKQAVDTGAVKNNAVKRYWDASGNNNMRNSHRAMEGQLVGLEEPFLSPSGARLMHPHDVSLDAPVGEIANCVCKVKTVIDWLQNSDFELNDL